jgi:hypothetical protein
MAIATLIVVGESAGQRACQDNSAEHDDGVSPQRAKRIEVAELDGSCRAAAERTRKSGERTERTQRRRSTGDVQVGQRERRYRANRHPLTARPKAGASGGREERHGVPPFRSRLKLTLRRLADCQGSTFETT